MVLEEALSLLVDGYVIHEAIIVSNSKIKCFPCVHVYDSLLLIKELVNNLTRRGVLRNFCDYLTIREDDYTMVVIPLREDLVLILVSHTALLDFGKIVKEVLRGLRKLSKVQAPHQCNGVSKTKSAETIM
mgnify:CR=1 FL=1